MPLHNLGDGCWKWGEHGEKYCGPGARQKALKQMKAIFHSGYKGEGSKEFIEEVKAAASELTEVEFNEILGDKEIPLAVRVELSRAKK